jgi:hypothetical protein
MNSLEIDVGDIRPVSVSFTADELVVTLADGRRIATPLAWYDADGHSLARTRRGSRYCQDVERSSSRVTAVMPGFDLGIHRSSREDYEAAGLPGQARQ